MPIGDLKFLIEADADWNLSSNVSLCHQIKSTSMDFCFSLFKNNLILPQRLQLSYRLLTQNTALPE